MCVCVHYICWSSFGLFFAPEVTKSCSNKNICSDVILYDFFLTAVLHHSVFQAITAEDKVHALAVGLMKMTPENM